MTDDVKNLLSRALGQEPPLRIDRDEVIQQGRKRLRRRRMFEAGSVVAAVVVVAVGAATLTNLDNNTDQQMPPAASRTQSAPPGPALPLPTAQTTTTTTTKLPGSSPQSQPSSPVQLSVPTSFPGAGELTTSLYNSGVVTSKDVRPLPGGPDGVPGFRRDGDTFVYQADVYRSPADAGSLQITVDFTTDTRAACSSVPTAYGDCVIIGTGGPPVTVNEWRGKDGERRVLAVTVLPDGTRFAAIASNISASDRDTGKQPNDTPPVLSSDELSAMIVKVSFGVG